MMNTAYQSNAGGPAGNDLLEKLDERTNEYKARIEDPGFRRRDKNLEQRSRRIDNAIQRLAQALHALRSELYD